MAGLLKFCEWQEGRGIMEGTGIKEIVIEEIQSIAKKNNVKKVVLFG